MTGTAPAFATTAGGFLLVLAIVLPVAGVLLSLVFGGRYAERIALGLMPVGFGVAAAIAVLLWRSGKPLVYILGGFTPPLGIALRADGFSGVMLMTAGDLGRRVFRARQFPDATANDRSAGAAGVLDAAPGHLGGFEHRLSRR
jgi:hypothetical protein